MCDCIHLKMASLRGRTNEIWNTLNAASCIYLMWTHSLFLLYGIWIQFNLCNTLYEHGHAVHMYFRVWIGRLLTTSLGSFVLRSADLLRPDRPRVFEDYLHRLFPAPGDTKGKFWNFLVWHILWNRSRCIIIHGYVGNLRLTVLRQCLQSHVVLAINSKNTLWL